MKQSQKDLIVKRKENLQEALIQMVESDKTVVAGVQILKAVKKGELQMKQDAGTTPEELAECADADYGWLRAAQKGLVEIVESKFAINEET